MKPGKTNLYSEIRQILEQARGTAVRAVNFSMVIAYWQIGKRIVGEEQSGKRRAGYGEFLLEDLSNRLTKDFGQGFTYRNLAAMRQFFLTFPILHALRAESSVEDNSKPIMHALHAQLTSQKKAKSHALRGFSEKRQIKLIRHAARDESPAKLIPLLRNELSWTHYRMLVKVESAEARNYYMNEAADENWSTRTLERQINTLYFERLLSSKNKNAIIQKTTKEAADDKPSILDFIKDPYVLEFLNLNPNATLYEKELETELLNKLQLFLLELGKGFAFIEREKRISADGDEFRIDLVFYNYHIKCFVLFDLKVGKLSHQDIGQMDLYVRYFEDNIKLPNDNPAIGIILCNEKNETIVKYSILKESKQLFASKYKLYLPTEKELIAELKSELNQLKNKKMK
ncbi:MAG: PDDEXK nuclease domain-containing protein [Bacteroidota bacterium]